MAWTKFTEGGRSFAPRATISMNGSLSFNEGACARFKIKDAPVAVLYYDDEQHRVGVELSTDPQTDGARKIRRRRMGADIAAKPFLDKFDIQPPSTMLYPLARDEESGYLVIRLDEGKPRNKGGGSTDAQET